MKLPPLAAAPLLFLALPTAVSAKAKAPACPPVTAFNNKLTHLDGYRLFVGPDGDSAVEPYRIDARIVPMLKTGKQLALIELPKPGTRAPQIVVGAADVELPLHPPPYKEMFVLLSGGFTFRTNKVAIAMKPGSILFFDDVGASHGHGGTIGPCGYVSLSIAPSL